MMYILCSVFAAYACYVWGSLQANFLPDQREILFSLKIRKPLDLRKGNDRREEEQVRNQRDLQTWVI